MARIEVERVPNKPTHDKTLQTLAEFCWHYPQYTLVQAKKLQINQFKALLAEARRQEALRMYNLTNIVAAPHSKKGQAVKKLSNHFKKEVDG